MKSEIWRDQIARPVYTPTKYMSSLSGFVPSIRSPRFVPVSASRKVTNALLGSFFTIVVEGMGIWAAEVAAFAEGETLSVGIFTVSCSLPSVYKNDSLDLVPSYADNFAKCSLLPEIGTRGSCEATPVSRRS